jgi:hypothetical protein
MKNHTIWVYALCYNEGHFVKNFLTGYKDADKIIVLNNMSTDDSVEFLQEDPRVEIRDWDSGGQIRDDLYLEMKNNVWKEARGEADWVIVVDFDEIFTRAEKMPNDAKKILKDEYLFDLDLTVPHNDGFNVIRPYGYNMVSLHAPLYADGHPHEYSNMGAYHVPSEKMCCFRPDQISEINYVEGAHWASPLDMDGGTENVKVYFQPEFKLLHYKFWNIDYYMKRMKEYQKRMSEQNKEHGWGYHYLLPLEDHDHTFRNGYKMAEPLFEIKSPYEDLDDNT